uniref:Helix-turn-helix domain-containing protein n=1 Tax=Globodera rostochiensis TaxID=31243 RepID=A0A914HQE0_GLORO
MNEFWILILVSFFATNLLDKAESVQLFDEIFGEGWWDNDKDEEWNKLTLEQNALHQIDRQNTQFGQIEPNSTDQLGQIEPNSTDQLGQIEPNSTDQNPPLTESDHFDNVKNGEEQNEIILNENISEDERKQLGISFRTIYTWKSELGQTKPQHKHSDSEQKELMQLYYEIKGQNPKISDKDIAKRLNINRVTLYKWKKHFK